MGKGLMGRDTLRADMQALKRDLLANILPQAIDAGLATLADAVRDAEPVGETGELRAHVKVKPATVKGHLVIGEVYDDSAHAAFREFGTSRMAADPAMRSTFDGRIDRLVGEIAGAIDDGIARRS